MPPTATPGTLIETDIDAEDPLKSVAGYTPATSNVNAETDTVAGQFNKLVASDNPLIAGARGRANEGMNARGLINSSMAIEAGEKAASEVALPIAAADANTYNTNRLTNQAATNKALETTAGAQTAGAVQQLKGNQTEVLANIEGTYKTLLQSSASAASYFNTVSKNVNDTLNDNNLSTEQKQATIETQKSLLQAMLSVIGGIANADLVALLDFTTTP